jgi:hypothetical protein
MADHRLNNLLDDLTELVLVWERRALADSLPKCDPGSTLYVEQKAWSRARSNDALELARLVGEYRKPSAEESSCQGILDSSTSTAKHKAWKGW